VIRDEVTPVQAFESVLNSLTEEEQVILDGRCNGLNMTEIAEELNLATSTTSAKARVIYEKMADYFDEDQADSMEFICMRYGYEQALRDVTQIVTGRKRKANPSG
jgi:FixJ family two-component response regulator